MAAVAILPPHAGRRDGPSGGFAHEMTLDQVAESLLRSKEPSIRWKGRVLVRGEDPSSRSIRGLQERIRRSPEVKALLERLLHWQWPDGGWNCDRNPSADTSSFWESRHPMLGLAVYADCMGTRPAADAARRASEVFLGRELFLERHTGRVMNDEFLALHYPLYYAYDILGGLKATAEIGRICDPRCRQALDLLESKQLPGGGWAAERRLYEVSSAFETRADSVDWGGAQKTALNEWVTADALYVLRAAGRW